MSTYLGLDLSLTSTGYAALHHHRSATTGRIRTTARGPARLREIRDAVTALVRTLDPELVAVEGYAFGRPNGMAALGELGGVIRLALHEHGQAYLDVPPAVVKKYATGKGNAGKEDVLAAAIRRLDYSGSSNDEADALWLAHIAAARLGQPAVILPATHAAALDKVGPPVLGAQNGTLYATHDAQHASRSRAELDQNPTRTTLVPVSPDCVVAKHAACAGASWNHTTDTPAECPCLCHRVAAER